ncbi:MAG: hypothetical protein JWM93_1043 [Frankiales bacterium]|nr:hypothetical protein [Frankiales bacterium]
MMNDEELGRELEFLLRSEADTVQPIGDGLQTIRTKIDRRRSRRIWVVPVSALAGTAAVATIAYTIFGGTDPNKLNQIATTNTATSTTTSTHSPTATTTTQTAVPVGDATLAVWPFATATDAQSWNKGDASTEWMANMKLVAQKFVATFGGNTLSQVTAEQPVTIDGDITVPISRKADNGPTIPIALVHLHQWGNGALSVTEVTKPEQGFTTLSAGGVITSGDELRGIHHAGGEDRFAVSVYAAGNTTPLGKSTAAPVTDTEWSTSLNFDSGNAVSGSVVAVDGSMLDGGIGTMIAVPVRFETNGEGTPTPTTSAPSPSASDGTALPGYMTTFVGIKDGRVAIFGTVSGTSKTFLTDAQAGGGDSNPSMSPDRSWVYFLRGTGTCANEIARVPFPGGNESQVEVVKTPSQGYVFGTMSAGANGSVTWIERQCANDQNLALGWANAANGASGRIAVNGGPPTFTGTPRLSPDATKIAVFYVSGMLHSIHVYDVTSATSIDDSLAGGCTLDQGCQGIDFDWAADGSFVVLSDPSSLVRAVPGAQEAVPLFASEGTIGRQIDLSKDGTGILVWDPQAKHGTYFSVPDPSRAVPSDMSYTGSEAPGTW